MSIRILTCGQALGDDAKDAKAPHFSAHMYMHAYAGQAPAE